MLCLHVIDNLGNNQFYIVSLDIPQSPEQNKRVKIQRKALNVLHDARRHFPEVYLNTFQKSLPK